MISEFNSSGEVDLIFPTPILKMKNESYAKKMLPIVKRFLDKQELLTYQWNYKTTFQPSRNLEHFIEFDEFCSYVNNIGENFLRAIGYNFTGKLISTVFASDIVKNDFHRPHTHPNSFLSGVFYLQAPKDCSRIIFHDPRPPRKQIFSYQNAKNHNISDKVIITPEDGMLLLWESWLQHEVEKSRTDDSRITLVFDLQFRDP